MRRIVIFAALGLAFAAQAMPLGLRTAMWGVAPRIRLMPDASSILPELGDGATAEQIADVFAAFSDGAAFTGWITNADQYAVCREWALSAKDADGAVAGARAVKDSPHAWLSFALGADRLIGKEIASNDVHIVSFGAADNGGGAVEAPRPARFTFELAIDGVDIGSSGAVALETLKENLKKVLGIEGATTLAPDAFSADYIEITFDAPIDGKARFTVKLPADAGDTYFMRVKMK